MRIGIIADSHDNMDALTGCAVHTMLESRPQVCAVKADLFITEPITIYGCLPLMLKTTFFNILGKDNLK
jgi:hypothetical protein